MNKTRHKVELLAPAGSMEAFLGAIHAGADAVYVGGEKFSARAYADNLSTEELCLCIRYAHLFGRRVYLTLNTLIKEAEFPEIYDFVQPFYEAGLDGVILQDFGVLSFLRREFPGLLLHASTQMAITGPDIVPWCKEHGISRIVPARELSLQELKEIREAGIEVECFVHGAMCYCYSGMCLMSSILGGRSGNRGRCAQPCRLPYEAEGEGFHTKECYPLSLKDMCTIDHLPQLIEAGMSSFKIEGRMKRSEYAAGVTAVYRKYIDLYFENPDQPLCISKKDRAVLNHLYIRSDAQDGYLFKQNGREMVTGEKPGYEEVPQELLDRIRCEHLEQKLTYPISMRAEFRVGEAAKLFLKAGLNLNTELCSLDRAEKAGRTKRFDDQKLTSECAKTDQKADSMHQEDSIQQEVCVTGPFVEHAQKLPSDETAVRKQLSKLGNTFFTLRDLGITVEGDVFLPNGMLNQLRRNGIAKLEDTIIDGFFPELKCRKNSANGEGDSFVVSTDMLCPGEGKDAKEKRNLSQTGLSVLVSTPEQLNACLSHPVREQLRLLYISENCLYGLDAVTEIGNCALVLPYISRSKDRPHLTALFDRAKRSGVRFLLVRNLEELGLIRELHMEETFELIADASLYCWNREAKAFLLKEFVRLTLPYELNSREIRRLTDERTERVIYGYIPLMQSANCLYRALGACRLKKEVPFCDDHSVGNEQYDTVYGKAFLTDRLHKRFSVQTDCRYCYNTIYNSVPLSLHNKLDRLQGANCRLQFTLESADEVRAVLDYYFSWLTDHKGSKPAHFPCEEFTTAHENRQVE